MSLLQGVPELSTLLNDGRNEARDYGQSISAVLGTLYQAREQQNRVSPDTTITDAALLMRFRLSLWSSCLNVTQISISAAHRSPAAASDATPRVEICRVHVWGSLAG
jgi:hypothetical protein